MLRTILKTGALSLLVAAIAGVPLQLLAQTTNKAAADKKAGVEKKAAPDKKEPAAKKASAHPFHGKLAGVDMVAKTIKLGKSTYQVTSETKITKDGKPATLADGVVGEEVGGYAKPLEDGKMVATSLRFGPKPESGAEKKKEPSEKSAKEKK